MIDLPASGCGSDWNDVILLTVGDAPGDSVYWYIEECGDSVWLWGTRGFNEGIASAGAASRDPLVPSRDRTS